jgi:hypothetical protein
MKMSEKGLPPAFSTTECDQAATPRMAKRGRRLFLVGIAIATTCGLFVRLMWKKADPRFVGQWEWTSDQYPQFHGLMQFNADGRVSAVNDSGETIVSHWEVADDVMLIWPENGGSLSRFRVVWERLPGWLRGTDRKSFSEMRILEVGRDVIRVEGNNRTPLTWRRVAADDER